MTKKKNIFITFLISISLYIGVSLLTVAIQGVIKSDVLGTIFGGLIGAAGIYALYRKKVKEDLHNFKDDFKKYFPKILLVSTILILLEIAISLTLYHFGIISVNQNIAEYMIKGNPILYFISAAIVSPIVEEFSYRLPYTYSKGNKIVIYIFYSLIFASIHLFGMYELSQLLFFIPYLLLSFGIGYGFYKTDNIFMSTIVHILNNIIAVMLILL